MDHDRPSEHARHVGRQPLTSSGLAVAVDRRRIVASPAIVEAAGDVRLVYTILEDEEPLTTFDELHERRMHLIVVRRDLTGFQHLHPRMDTDGTWQATASGLEPGVWRAFADFSAGGIPTTLGTDVLVAGDFRPHAIPDAIASTKIGSDVVTMERTDEGVHRFEVVADGEVVRPEPYLGALGHLVVLRWGDLAFLHVHPVSDEELAFQVAYPSPGRYRCFLQYVVDDDVRTAAFTSVI